MYTVDVISQTWWVQDRRCYYKSVTGSDIWPMKQWQFNDLE